ncbi:DUF4209 domain-containing protein [Empedobacter sp.]|uniref:DUF4209 domain-containing protein n=1 Tax=Empedobacter sp. TaxID=1927715 RepID=UPI00289B29D8|nr:DUF4209 domain-containing protein [Empedobacter sp.]
MTLNSNQIPDNLFSNKLYIQIYNSSFENEELKNLLHLLKCELNDENLKQLIDKQEFQYPLYEINNIEIIARINDIKFIKNESNKIDSLKLAVENYLEVYKITNETKYFIRALQLVNKVKNIFKDDLPKYENGIIDVFFNSKSSLERLKLIENLQSLINSEHQRDKLINYSLEKIKKNNDDFKFSDSLNYIDILKIIKHYTAIECKINKALCLEKDADYENSNKESNTYYPNVLTKYKNALREVKGIVEANDIKLRLESKIKIEQKLYIEMLNHCGISYSNDSTIKNIIKSLSINDFSSAFSSLITFPIIRKDDVQKASKTETSFVGQYFQDFVHLTNKGTVAGIANEQQFYENQIRDYSRGIVINVIREIKSLMDINHQEISKDVIAMMILKCESIFIPEERVGFFIEGIYQGFLNNYSLAAHILVPQVENSLKHIIELNGRSVTKTSNDIENDNSLGGILDIKNPNKMLNGICDDDLINELNNFLVNGYSTNFRNRLCHGLLTEFEADYYGIYIWWLTLKMIKQTNQFFKLQ